MNSIIGAEVLVHLPNSTIKRAGKIVAVAGVSPNERFDIDCPDGSGSLRFFALTIGRDFDITYWLQPAPPTPPNSPEAQRARAEAAELEVKRLQVEQHAAVLAIRELEDENLLLRERLEQSQAAHRELALAIGSVRQAARAEVQEVHALAEAAEFELAVLLDAIERAVQQPEQAVAILEPLVEHLVDDSDAVTLRFEAVGALFPDQTGRSSVPQPDSAEAAALGLRAILGHDPKHQAAPRATPSRTDR